MKITLSPDHGVFHLSFLALMGWTIALVANTRFNSWLLLEPRRQERVAIERRSNHWKIEDMEGKDLKALFLHQLKDTYFAENAIVKALPNMAAAAQAEELRGALAVHLEETKNHVARLDQVFKRLGEQAQGVECKAILGIIAEGDEVVEEFSGGEALDAGLIAAAQAVEHYEITRYGTMIAWAKQLGLSEIEDLLKETLAEEESTDEALSELAEDAINPKAA